MRFIHFRLDSSYGTQHRYAKRFTHRFFRYSDT